MSTVGQLVDQTIHRLTGSRPGERNRLNADITDAATTLTLTYAVNSLPRGSLLEIEQESMYVWDATNLATTPSVTVERGYGGSTAVAHIATRAVSINPEVTRRAVFEELLAEVRDLNGTNLRGYNEITLTPSSTNATIDLAGTTGDVLGVYDVTYDDAGDLGPVSLPFMFLSGRDAATFPSGMALRLGYLDATKNVRVIYTTAFAPFTSEADDVQTVCGVPAYAEDILTAGAMWRLTLAAETRRLSMAAQPARRAEDVQAGASALLSRQFKQMRDEHVASALAMQQQRYPLRRGQS